MPRPIFWPSNDSWVLDPFGHPVSGVPVRIWSARHGGVRLLDLQLVDESGTPVAAVLNGILTSDSDGMIPAFAGPDNGPSTVWADHGHSGTRLALTADPKSTGGGGGGGGVSPGDLTAGLALKADKTTSIAAGTGLTGGGDLSAGRTLAVVYGTTAGSAAAGNDSRITAIPGLLAQKADVSALNLKADLALLATKADLVGGLVPNSQLPPLAITDVYPVASQAEMLALTAQRGDVAVRADNGKTYILRSNSPTTLADWLEVQAVGVVTSVAGKTGNIMLVAADIQSGVFDIARLPVGQTAGTVASGADPRFTALADADADLAAAIDALTLVDAELSAEDGILHGRIDDLTARVTALEGSTPPAAEPPGAPTGVVAQPGVRRAGVSFNAPADDGGAAITQYVVRASTGQQATGAASPVLVTGLTEGVAVTFTVAARNSAGVGPQSAPSAPVTPIAPPVTPDPPAYEHALGTASITASSATLTLTTTQAAAAGDSIILAIVCNGNPGSMSVKDSSANLYAADGAPVTNGTATAVMIYSSLLVNALPAGSTITITFATARNLAAVQGQVFSGLPSTSVDGIGVGTANATTALTTGPVTTSYDGDLLFAAWAMAAGNTLPDFDAGPGWTAAGASGAMSGSSRVLFTQYRIQDTAGSVTPAATVDSPKNWAGIALAYPPVDTSDQVGSGATGTYSDLLTLQAAASIAIQGDVITLAPDTVFAGKLTLAGLRGTAAHPIVIQGSSTSILDNGSPSNTGYPLYLDDCQYVHVKGLQVRNSQKGIMVDRSISCLIEDVEVSQIGHEGIHLRNETSYCIVRRAHVHHTGRTDARYGEGLYCGTAQSNWGAVQRIPAEMRGYPDVCVGNQFIDCNIHNVTAECMDSKEGTYGCVLRGCTFDGTEIQGANFADSWVDIKGESWVIEGNTGNTIMTNAFEVHEIDNFDSRFLSPYVDGLGISHAGVRSGASNVFDNNTGNAAPATGYGFMVGLGVGNVVYSNNSVIGAATGVSDVALTTKP